MLKKKPIIAPLNNRNSNSKNARNPNRKEKNQDDINSALSRMADKQKERPTITFGEAPPATTVVDLTLLLSDNPGRGFRGFGFAHSKKESMKVAPTDRDAARQVMRDLLHARGWCFVRLPQSLRLAGSPVKALRDFFADTAESKARYEAPFGYGYSTVDHKDGLRLLTGYSRLTNFMEKPGLPNKLQPVIKQLCSDMDDTCVSIMFEMAEMMNVPPNEMCLKADLPAAYLNESHFGMLDIAHYFNERAGPTPQPAEGSSVDDVNCVPHFDPGLVTVSFFSDCEGLQLKDPLTDEWIDGPVNSNSDQEDLGILWLGHAAVVAFDGQLKAGIHRVVYPNEAGKERLTAWYEGCTLKQALDVRSSSPFLLLIFFY